MPLIPVIGLCLVIVILPTLFIDWHARFVFVATGYPRRYGHGKSFNRAHKHYKESWTLIQRLLWIPLFKESYEQKYRIMAYFSYTNSILSIMPIVLIIGCAYLSFAPKYIYPVGLVYIIFLLIRFWYDTSIGKKKI